MPYGYLIGNLIFGALVALTLTAPRRPRPLAGLAYRAASVYNEAPFLFIYLIAIFAIGPVADADLSSLEGWVVVGLPVLVIVGFLHIASRGAQERTVVERAVNEGLGTRWREATSPSLLEAVRKRPPLAQILFLPFVFRPAKVKRIGNVPYGDAGRYNLLDIYHRRDLPDGAPVLIYFHGGGYYGGRKSVEGRALLFRLASQGWVTISANYRLRPRATFFDHLIDVKKVIAWVREHGQEYRADPLDPVPLRWLRRWPPLVDSGPHAERAAISARLRRCRHLGDGGGQPLWLVQRLLRDGWAPERSGSAGSLHRRCPAVLHRTRCGGLPGVDRDSPPFCGPPPCQFTESHRVRRAAPWSARFRPLPFLSILSGRRRHRSLRRMGEIAEAGNP